VKIASKKPRRICYNSDAFTVAGKGKQVGKTRSWAAYPATYRAAEIQILLGWVRAGVSGAVIGGPGSGKSNLLGYICNRPDVIQPGPEGGEDIYFIALDLNNLPGSDLATFYRSILRAFYETRDRFDDALRARLVSLFAEYQHTADPFVAQTALRAWLLQLQERDARVVFVIDRFDWFCEQAPAEMADSLRGLRDSFKDTVSFIAGTRRELVYFAEREALGELYELLDTFACWMQPMAVADARALVTQETSGRLSSEEEIGRLLALSGGYPALLKTACHWWLSQETLPPPETWAELLCRFPAMAYRLEALWQSFSSVEQQALYSLLDRESAAPPGSPQAEQRQQALAKLQAQGIIAGGADTWRIRSGLMAAYAATASSGSRGGLRLDGATGAIFQGEAPLDDLSPLEGALLRYLLAHPYARHTHTELIEAAWPEDTLRAGVSTEALYQVVRGLRRKIEPYPSRPRYVVSWRGTPEGGYRCFPEGRPG
jgi:hypothetical protein